MSHSRLRGTGLGRIGTPQLAQSCALAATLRAALRQAEWGAGFCAGSYVPFGGVRARMGAVLVAAQRPCEPQKRENKLHKSTLSCPEFSCNRFAQHQPMTSWLSSGPSSQRRRSGQWCTPCHPQHMNGNLGRGELRSRRRREVRGVHVRMGCWRLFSKLGS